MDRHDQEYALGLLQQAVSRNPQNSKLLELYAPVFYLIGCAGLITSSSTLNIQRQLQPAEQELKPKRANQIHSKAQNRSGAVPRVRTEHAFAPPLDKPPTKAQEGPARHEDQQEEEDGRRRAKSRRKKVSWVDDTDYNYLEPETGSSRRTAQRNRKKVVEVIDVDGDSSEDDWLPRKAPPAKRRRRAV